jgi:hypothetical protein
LKRNNDFGASHGLLKDSVANVKSSPWTKISLQSGLGNSRAQSWSYCFLESTLCLEGSPCALTLAPDGFHTNFFTCKSSGLGVLTCT